MIAQGAQFSSDRQYRYSLWRIWEKDAPYVMFIGLNPSTADEKKDDPTVRRCIGFARAWGYGGIHMLNLFALRSTDPREIYKASMPIGPENNNFLLMYAKASELVIAAWGVHGAFENRGHEVAELLGMYLGCPQLYCIGKTKEGHPKHPLYLPSDSKPVPFFNET